MLSCVEHEKRYYLGPRPHVYKNVLMLNSVEHEILHAHKYKNIKKFGFF